MSVIVRGSGPREGFPNYIVKRLKRDKVGVLQGVVERHFKVGSEEQRIRPEWIDQGLAPNPNWGIPCMDCDVVLKDGIAIVSYFFEGQENEYSFAESAVLYEIDTTMQDEPIETHPTFAKLVDLYGWSDDQKTFPRFISGTAALNAAKTQSVEKENPLFGVQTWRALGLVFRKTYARRSVPPSVYQGIGTVIAKPDGLDQLNFPPQPNRPWIKQAPKIERRGNVTQISEETLLGPPGSIDSAKIIYSVAALGSRGPGGPSGKTDESAWRATFPGR